MKKISVIVPVYNVEEYLPKCIESIVHQTYKNLEIILINDGSTDKSGYICDRYKKIDKRIQVIHKQNEGLSQARNLGIEYCSGEIISFVDSDDFLDRKMYEIAYLNMDKYNCDIVCFNCNHYIDGKHIMKDETIKDYILYNDKNAFGKDYFHKYNMNLNVVWNKIYRRSIFDNIRFPYKRNYEDIFSIMSIYMKCESILVIPEALYNYRINRKNSIMCNFNKKKKAFDLEYTEARIIWAIDYKAMCNNIVEGNEWLFHIYKVAFDEIILSDKRSSYIVFEKFLIKNLKEMLKDNISIKSKIGILKRIINVELYCRVKKFIRGGKIHERVINSFNINFYKEILRFTKFRSGCRIEIGIFPLLKTA